MGAKKISTNQWKRILNAIGLKLNAQTGGAHLENIQIVEPLEGQVGKYYLELFDGTPVYFMNGPSFNKTVIDTEKTLKIKLFG
jgi:hypothetical protein